MPKAKHYAKGFLLWNCMAYVDQWEKVMAVFDERDNLRAVVREIDCGTYGVLLIGDSAQAFYKLDNMELGSTGKNMEACFQIYCQLPSLNTPTYLPSYHKTKQVNLDQIFPHTRVGAIRTRGFRVTTDDLSERITRALERYNEIVNSDVVVSDCSRWEKDDHEYPDTVWEGGIKMHHIGDGSYCDDDGDNWHFF